MTLMVHKVCASSNAQYEQSNNCSHDSHNQIQRRLRLFCVLLSRRVSFIKVTASVDSSRFHHLITLISVDINTANLLSIVVKLRRTFICFQTSTQIDIVIVSLTVNVGIRIGVGVVHSVYFRLSIIVGICVIVIRVLIVFLRDIISIIVSYRFVSVLIIRDIVFRVIIINTFWIFSGNIITVILVVVRAVIVIRVVSVERIIISITRVI